MDWSMQLMWEAGIWEKGKKQTSILKNRITSTHKRVYVHNRLKMFGTNNEQDVQSEWARENSSKTWYFMADDLNSRTLWIIPKCTQIISSLKL